MYSFLMAAVTNYHKLGGLKTTHIYSLTVLETRNLPSVSWSQNRSVSRAAGGESISLSFPVFKAAIFAFFGP